MFPTFFGITTALVLVLHGVDPFVFLKGLQNLFLAAFCLPTHIATHNDASPCPDGRNAIDDEDGDNSKKGCCNQGDCLRAEARAVFLIA